jgi:geranylgeranyl diphosphate synthase type II
MVQSLSVATKPSPVAGDLSESWRVLRERYALLLVDRLRLDDPLRAVAIHALQGGKRIRPMLAELLGRALGAPQDAVADVAVAVEYLHTASVMLDDLPCMDDAVERREVPAAHVRFSEAEVILTAVALLSRSYAVLLLAPVRLEDCRGMTLLASETVAGAMALGQAMELAPGGVPSPGAIQRIHEQKTASLFGLLGRLVSGCAEASAGVTEKVVTYTTLLGRAYQIMDDIEDRNEPGEARANLARVGSVEDAGAEARERLAAARRIIADIDATGELGAFVGWLEQRVTPGEA